MKILASLLNKPAPKADPTPAPEPLKAASKPLDDYADRLDAAVGSDFGPYLPPDAQEPLQAKATEDQSIENLGLGKSPTKALVRAGFETIGDLREFEGDWTEFAGIGAKTAESITEALEGYQDAPTTEDEPAPAEDAPALSVAFDGLVLATHDLTLSGLGSWKVVDGAQLFDDLDDAAVLAGLRVFAEYRKVVVTFPDRAPYVQAAQAFADKYGVPCFTTIPF